MGQLAITGNDGRSDPDVKAEIKAQAARMKAAIACAKKLEAASQALADFLAACNRCDDASKERGADDSRRILMANINEYAGHLDSVFNK